MLGPAAAGGMAGVAMAAAYAVRGVDAQWFCRSVSRGPDQGRIVALTFDDGPSEGTAELLDALARHGAPATFFQCGRAVRRLPAVARMVGADHEIGNHTESHPYLFLHTPAGIRREIGQAQTAIQENTGQTPRWFRPPYGVRWFGLRQALAEHGLGNVMWSVMGKDWALPAAAIVRRVLRLGKSGSIICLHDGREARPGADIRNTIAAVSQLLPRFLQDGYRFVTLSDMLCPGK